MSCADKTIACRDCQTDFVFTTGEQEFYAQKGFNNEPYALPSLPPEPQGEQWRRLSRSR